MQISPFFCLCSLRCNFYLNITWQTIGNQRMFIFNYRFKHHVMTNYDYDAIVIGSGISGGWAAKELTEGV